MKKNQFIEKNRGFKIDLIFKFINELDICLATLLLSVWTPVIENHNSRIVLCL